MERPLELTRVGVGDGVLGSGSLISKTALIGDKNSPYRVNFYMRLNLGISAATQIVFTPSGNPIYVLYEEFDAHCKDFSQHITPAERTAWNGKAAGSHNHDTAYAPLAHAADAVKHITPAERSAWSGKVGKSTSVTATLTAAGWTGAAALFTQILSIAAVTATSANEVLRPLALTEAIRDAWDAAAFADGGQSAGKLTVAAWGEKPIINLPCRIRVTTETR